MADDLNSSNSISFQQSAGPQVYKPSTVFSKPLINKNNTIQSISDTDIIDHGALPSWSADSNSWTQLKQAIAARVDANAVCFDGGTSILGDLGTDANKWYGGVLAPNGCIYGVPFNSTTILKIDPDTDAITTFGDLAGTAKWVGGVLSSNGCIYCIPHTSTTILKIDPDTDAITTFGDLAGDTKWAGGVVSIDGYIYGMPYNSTAILKIDPSTDTATTFDSLAGTNKWIGGVLAPNGKIYGIPYDSTAVLVLDPTTDTTTTFGSFAGTHKWSGGILSLNGFIFTVPRYTSVSMRIDPSTDTATSFGNLATSNYVAYKEITISHTNVDSDLSDFPLCVRITNDSDIGSYCLASGDDIDFFDLSGNKLYTEMESFSVTDLVATGVFWVKIPTVSSSEDTVIRCYYGNASAGARTDTTLTWDSNFVAVYHYANGTTLSVADSTANAKNGTNFSATAAAAKVNGGANTYYNKYVRIPRSISADWTISFWFYATTTGGTGTHWYRGRGLVDSEVAGTANDFGSSLMGYTVAFGVGNPDTTIKTGNLNLNTWYRATLTRVSSTGAMKIFINGASAASRSTGPTGNRAASSTIAIGKIQTSSSAANFFYGTVDEIQFSDVVRSDAWIKFDYYNQESNEISWGSAITSNSWCGGLIAPHGKILCAPKGYSAGILQIDPNIEQLSSYGDASSAASTWHGLVLSANGSIYGIPHTGAHVLKIGQPLDDIQSDFPLSRYFNKF